LTYRDLAERLGISVEAAQQKARRGRWQRRDNNDGRRLVLVPYETLDTLMMPGSIPPTIADTITSTTPDTILPVPPIPVAPAVHGIADHVEALIDELRQRATTAEAREQAAIARFDQERQQIRKEVEDARLAADRLRSELETERQHARDMATRIDRLHQERHAEAEKHRQEMDGLRAALEDARRPWLRRLIARWTGKP
jgi:phage terminase small subunit